MRPRRSPLTFARKRFSLSSLDSRALIGAIRPGAVAHLLAICAKLGATIEEARDAMGR